MARDESVQRRLKAARALAGITVTELAGRIDEAGLGVGTLGAIERGERDAQRSELVVIADACGLPYEFFTTDLAKLGTANGNGEVVERLDALDQKLSSLLEQQAPDREAAIAAAVERIADGVRAEFLDGETQTTKSSPTRKRANS